MEALFFCTHEHSCTQDDTIRGNPQRASCMHSIVYRTGTWANGLVSRQNASPRRPLECAVAVLEDFVLCGVPGVLWAQYFFLGGGLEVFSYIINYVLEVHNHNLRIMHTVLHSKLHTPHCVVPRM